MEASPQIAGHTFDRLDELASSRRSSEENAPDGTPENTNTTSLRKSRRQSKLSQRSSSSSSEHKKFNVEVDGLHAFKEVIQRLGKNNKEMHWHDLRKMYHRETGRQLTVDEMNAIFGVSNVLKHSLFELPQVKLMISPVEGSRLQRFMLTKEPTGMFQVKTNGSGTPYLSLSSEVTSADQQELSQSTSSPVEVSSPMSSPNFSTQEIKVEEVLSSESNENLDPALVSKEIDIDVQKIYEYLPSDLEMSASFSDDACTHSALSHQVSMQSSITEDEGIEVRLETFDRQTRAYNSSPEGEEANDELGPNEVFEDAVDSLMAFRAIPQVNFSEIVLPVIGKEETLAFACKAAPPTPKSGLPSVVADTTIVHEWKAKTFETPAATADPAVSKDVDALAPPLGTPPPIRELIAKFESNTPSTPTARLSPRTFAERGGSATTSSVYARIRDEMGSLGSDAGLVDVADLEKDESMKKFVSKHCTGIDKFDADGDAEAKLQEVTSSTSVDNRYLYSKYHNYHKDFSKSLSGRSKASAVDEPLIVLQLAKECTSEKSLKSDEERVTTTSATEEMVTVVERKVDPLDFPPVATNAFNKVGSGKLANAESDADIPYSCSEDEDGTLASNVMTEKEKRSGRIISVSVELDAKARKGEMAVDVPKKENVVDGDDSVGTLNRTLEVALSALPAKPDHNVTLPDGAMKQHRRLFSRRPECCTVM